jgi:hypothetical protein
MLRSWVLAPAVVCVFCVGTPSPAAAAAKAAAGTPPASSSAGPKPGGKITPALKKKASALFEEGFKALDSGDYEACERKFDEAYRTVPMPVVLLKIAECRKRSGAYAGAVDALERYLSERADAPDRAVVEAQIADLKKRPGTVTVTSTPQGAAIWVDGSDTRKITPDSLELSPEEHSIELRLPSYAAEEQRIVVTYGSMRDLDLTLSRRTDDPTPPPRLAGTPEASNESGYRTTTAFWIFAGGAVAAGGVATVFGVMALNKHSQFEENPTQELYDDGRRDALIADIALGAAAASAITAGVLFFSSKGSGSPADRGLTVAPSFGRAGGGLVGHVRF